MCLLPGNAAGISQSQLVISDDDCCRKVYLSGCSRTAHVPTVPESCSSSFAIAESWLEVRLSVSLSLFVRELVRGFKAANFLKQHFC